MKSAFKKLKLRFISFPGRNFSSINGTVKSMASKRILAIFDKYGETDYIGEPISVLSHSIQAANVARNTDPSDKELIIAALLHDIGHAVGMEAGQEMEMEGCGVTDHEFIGERFTASLGFSSRVQKLIRSHVSAKRYLCYKDESYYNKLTDASKTTLRYQGGPMNAEEAFDFEKDEDFEKMLLMRNFDETAKDVNAIVPSLDFYVPMIDELSNAASTANGYLLSDLQLKFWNENGYLKVSNLLSYENILPGDVSDWVNEISNWPKTENKWLLHWELTQNNEKQMCRAENFVDYHAGMKAVCMDSLLPVVGQLFNETAVLFKEKINYKLPGGAGFSAHQDSPAYIGLANDHISVMIAVDAANESNGGLELAGGVWKDGQVPLDEKGVITPEAESKMEFKSVSCVPGDVLFFGGFTPHRSGPNLSTAARRAIFLTYNPLSQGNHKEAYYNAKHVNSLGFNASHAISFQGDFQGKIVA
jgi:predicted HD phosphohydrolase